MFLRFFGNLRSKVAKVWGEKTLISAERRPRQIKGHHVPWNVVTFDLPKCAYFCRTEHVVDRRSPRGRSKVNIGRSKVNIGRSKVTTPPVFSTKNQKSRGKNETQTY